MSSGFFVQLQNRGAVYISGPDRRSFLQGLITNDIDLLTPENMLYACLLTPQGKFLHDFLITEQDDRIRLECEGGPRAEDLKKRLSTFRLRSKIEIDHIGNINVFSCSKIDAKGFADPRHAKLGSRLYEQNVSTELQPFLVWDEHRLKLTIPDGSRDLQIEKSTLAEGRIDQLNGVSYTKGCYVGQELTTRMHYRGLAKRHLYTIIAEDADPLPEPGSDIKAGDITIGEMRSSCGKLGMALLRDDQIGLLTETRYRIFTSE